MIDSKLPAVKVEEPWRRFEQYTHNLSCTMKIIPVVPGGILSRKYHHWCVELDGRVLHPDPEEELFIPRETVHRLYSTGTSPVRILEEIAFGEFDEDCIVRSEDVNARV